MIETTTHMYSGYSEQTLLVPAEDSFSIDCFLQDIKYLQTKNGFAEFRFSFIPYTPTDYIQLDENMSMAMTKVEQRKSPYSRKVANPMFKDGKNCYYCSQLFEPKVNLAPEQIKELKSPTASLRLHFREDHEGDIFLQCEYCDVYDPDNGLDENISSDAVEDWEF